MFKADPSTSLRMTVFDKLCFPRLRTSDPGHRTLLRQYNLDPGHLAEVYQCRIQVFPVTKAGILIRPVLEHFINIAVGGYETVRPERNSAFELSLLELVRRRLEDCGSGNYHLEFAIYTA